MAEQRWTPADDDALRAQLALLRRDVEALPLPEVRFVKRRARRRHRRLVAGAAAAAAAAVVVAGYVGWHDLEGRDDSLVPAHPSTSAPVAVSPRPTPSGAPTGSTTRPTTDSTTGTSSPADGPAGAGTAPMEVVGTRPLLPSGLFVPAARWSSPGLTNGHPTSDMAGDWEGSASIGLCDVDDAMDGTRDAGRFGIVTVRDDRTGSAVGRQRIRLVESDAAAAAERDRLVAGVLSCPSRVDGVTVTAAPGSGTAGAYRVDFANPHGGPVITEFIAVLALTGRPAVSTFVLNGGTVNPALEDGFAEVQRLTGLAGP